MPAYQAFLGKLNPLLVPGTEGALNPELFAPDQPWTDAADAAGITEGTTVSNIISAIPASVAEAMRAAIYSALTRDLAVTVAWAPSYDFELNVWEAPGNSEVGLDQRAKAIAFEAAEFVG